MAVYTLRYKSKISKKQAINKICTHAMFGNHDIIPRPKIKREVLEYFLRKNVNIDKLVEQCRSTKSFVPDFENLMGSTLRTVGASVSLVDSDGEVIDEMKSPGLFIWSNYEAHLEAACAARDRAVTENSYVAFQECLSQGFASIEAFINTQARSWNKTHPDDKFIDSKAHKVSLESKIDEWIPTMSSGQKVDKRGRVWNDFKTLKKLRDEDAIHPKLPGHCIQYKDLARYINIFRFGIAIFLGNIHNMLGQAIPSVLINAAYTPDVEVIEVSDSELSA